MVKNRVGINLTRFSITVPRFLNDFLVQLLNLPNLNLKTEYAGNPRDRYGNSQERERMVNRMTPMFSYAAPLRSNEKVGVRDSGRIYHL
jgi:hypothetical protein